MKKEIVLSITLLSVASAYGQHVTDSLKQVNLNEIIVSSTRVGKNTPIAYSNMNASQIKSNNVAKNIPFILQTLPSVVSYSEDGLGVGNTSMRIRGTDATRINVTLNGMPLNNPESQEVYWVNIPDISNSLQSIQVQRGVGSSTNGSAAFGASISLKTRGARSQAYGEAATAIGSYGTTTSTIAVGTGILKNGLSLDTRYSHVTSDGYIRNGKVNHKSTYAALSYFHNNQLLRLSYINGIQHTGITWEGISPEEMAKNRKYNPAGQYRDDAGNIHYYDNETDNYYSNIAQLTYSNELTSSLLLNVGFSYNHGYGYYENYKVNQEFSKYDIEPQIINNISYKSSDIISRQDMKNDFYVANITLNYTKNKANLVGGFSFTTFDGDHYGQILWSKYNEDISKKHEWYRNNAKKTDFSSFIRGSYQLMPHINAFVDMQYRYVSYKMNGFDDDLTNISSNHYFSFINPKVGLTYSKGGHDVYASLAIANREPLRTDIKESVKGGSSESIKAERLYDYELGYRFANGSASFNTNLYYMYYKDQMVQTGKLNDVGYKLMQNVPSSYRMGIELVGAYQFTKWMRMDVNLTLSSNKIKNYTAYYDVYDTGLNFVKQESEYLKKTNISFSPSIVSSGVLTFTPNDFTISLIGKYVGKQNYDNTSNKDNRLADYFIANLAVGYTFKTPKIGVIDVQFLINNLLNKYYVSNAWVSTDRFENGTEVTYKGLYPQATRNIMAKLGIRF